MILRHVLTGTADATSAGAARTRYFYGFRPLPAGNRIVTNELVEWLRTSEGI